MKHLKRRYLVWLYKTTKEALDKIERKFTQVEIDRFLIRELKKSGGQQKLQKFILEFESYVDSKEKDGLGKKYDNHGLNPDYAFLDLKLEAVEKTIIKELGKKALLEIKALYEREMTERILRSTEH